MSKVIDVTVLQEVLKDVIPEDNTEIIETIMGKSFETEPQDIQPKIDEAVKQAVETAQKEAQATYAKQLHDMFFNGERPADEGVKGDELRGSAEEKNEPVPDIFVPVEVEP